MSDISGNISNQPITPLTRSIDAEEAKYTVEKKGLQKTDYSIQTEEENLEALQMKLEEIVSQIAEQPSVNGDVLNRILRLLTELLPILQHIGTAQATQLNFPTKMQALYTELIAKAPVYTKDNPRFDKDDKKDDELRNEANQRVGIYTDRLRSYRDLWSDYGKKFQSNINTTNEAVNQQVDLLTTFLQQLRELVSLITR